ncbi:MAG: tRNA lysidine(34) synthetase TilS C-terminal domain-containing protein, partial [Myxococcota bacterium]
LHRLGGGHKTLAALMSDAGVPRLARPWIPVIHGRCGNVLWAPGVIRTRAATLSPQTVNLIVLSWTPDDADGEDGVF